MGNEEEEEEQQEEKKEEEEGVATEEGALLAGGDWNMQVLPPIPTYHRQFGLEPHHNAPTPSPRDEGRHGDCGGCGG